MFVDSCIPRDPAGVLQDYAVSELHSELPSDSNHDSYGQKPGVEEDGGLMMLWSLR